MEKNGSNPYLAHMDDESADYTSSAPSRRIDPSNGGSSLFDGFARHKTTVEQASRAEVCFFLKPGKYLACFY